MYTKPGSCQSLAAAITKAARKQTYYTIRFFVDRGRVPHAYLAYGYFRWVDDVLDSEAGVRSEKIAFLNRQKDLLEALYRGENPENLSSEENMLAELVRSDSGKNPGLQSYLRNMMAVMGFDTDRRGRMISQAELTEYSRLLATAVMDGLTYFIGQNQAYPVHTARYSAVAGAHISHMLRDAVDDLQAGYYNIPREVLEAENLSPADMNARAYRRWVRGRVALAEGLFRDGKRYIRSVPNLRARLSGLAYCASFESVLGKVKRNGYSLRGSGLGEARHVADGRPRTVPPTAAQGRWPSSPATDA